MVFHSLQTTLITFLLFTVSASANVLRRAECRTQQVWTGDTCPSLASKCGISGDQFMQYNPKQDLCKNLAEGQLVCCSAGTLPDRRPKQNSDGSCASYRVIKDDYCARIAAYRDLTVQQLLDFNKQTWGWGGCDNGKLLADMNICVSTGSPPMPAPVQNAVCGPQVPGTQRPTNGQSLASLNPCPLNACCNIWGQCGTTDEFCVDTNTGAPGTARTGTNGCISNCGSGIVNNGEAPAQFMKIGYFEAWQADRPCLRMSIDQVNPYAYTHIHFAFALITENYEVDLSKYWDQFVAFVKVKNTKRILSFGGWSFSTEPATYLRFREGVKEANREKLATNIANYIIFCGLDGVDIDWEYPGAPDLKDIPPGGPNEGNDYLVFIAILKGKLYKNEKSVSFAAPASYWYLKQFPINAMAYWVDYIVYMTYDLHGQWDYDNPWTNPACPTGNCLRSHVNITETANALSMITKAGVPAKKVIVGVSSYGRSFQMVDPNCSGPMCKFTGPASGATAGKCTGTPGYLADAEIKEILRTNPTARRYRDNTGSDIMIYNGNQWVAYLNESVKQDRAAVYKAFNFGGTTDWAIDLQESMDYTFTFEDPDEQWPRDNSAIPVCDKTFNTIDDLVSAQGSIDNACRDEYALDIAVKIAKDGVSNIEKILSSGYDKKFKTYARAISKQAKDALYTFVFKRGNEFMSCVQEQYNKCCSACKNCAGCDNSSGCNPDAKRNVTISCPTAPHDPDDTPKRCESIYWSFKDKNGFYEALGKDYGIAEDYTVVQPDYLYVYGSGKNLDICWEYGLPMGVNETNVPDPKNMVKLDYIKEYLQYMPYYKTMAQIQPDHVPMSDLADGALMPAMLVMGSVDAMNKVVEVAGDIQEKQRLDIILTFVTAFLFMIPGLEASAAVGGLATLARALRIAGIAGDSALIIYDAVKDPASLLFAAFNLVRMNRPWAKDFRSAGKAARNLGDNILDNLTTKNTILKFRQCRNNQCWIK